MAKFCYNCGNELDENTYICTKCGVVVSEDKSNKASNSNDNGGFGYGVLGFFFPLVGLILYLCWKNEKPNTAKSVGKGALINVIVGVALYIIGMFILGIVFSNIL